MRSHFLPALTGSKTKRSHLLSGAAIACATSVTALLPNTGMSQVAYDSAGNSIYGSGWSAGQNGGSGFGAWSFDGTSGGGGQEMSSAGAIGTAWTLYTTTSGSGISDVGRSITEAGGLQVGQTLQMVVQNPTSYNFYGGFDMMFLNSADNYPAGVPNGSQPLAGIRSQVFEYYTTYPYWTVQDNGGGNTVTTSSAKTTGAGGVQIDLKLDSATAYTLSIGTYTLNGTYSGPINYINFREYDGVGSSGPSDVADNFGISYMEIEAVPEPTTAALFGLGLGGLMFLRRKK